VTKRIARRQPRCKGDGLTRDERIRRLRVGELRQLFALRYGGNVRNDGWRFPDDDAGLEDLKILAHHTHPMAIPRMIRHRAPWAALRGMTDDIACEVECAQKLWRPHTLGKVLNFVGAEWRQHRFKTIAPVDMTAAQRRDVSRILSNGRRRQKRRMSGVQTRAVYEGQSLSRTKPWEAEGISKSTWYERRKKARTSAAAIKLTSSDQTCPAGRAGSVTGVVLDVRQDVYGSVSRPTQKPLAPDLALRLYGLGLLDAA
jgi:hypothetical protein